MTPADADALLDHYKKNRKAFSGFMNNVIDFFKIDNETLFTSRDRFAVHSVKYREKDLDHLKAKLMRKSDGNEPDIDVQNLFTRITDFCGVRVLHLRLTDFKTIHAAIDQHINNLHWRYAECPKAYTWDPEYKNFFEGFGVATELKESFYTSVHYVVKPNDESFVTCEIQVRSLFEEIWGEVDHDLNYPEKSANISCREQLKVLAKLVGAGTKLVDSIYSASEFYN